MNDETSAMNSPPMTSQRTIVHLDVDAFYVACERELRPDLQGRPLAVSQYNPYGDLRDCAIDNPSRILYDGWATAKDPDNSNNNKQQPSNPNSNGSLIAVSYEARARNVRRNDRGHDAVNKCPELCIVQVPVQNGKASLTIYRDASERLMKTLTDCMKNAAMDIYEDLIVAERDSDSNDDSNIRKKLGRIKVEKASVDEIYIDISVPVQTILDICKEEPISTSQTRGSRYNRLYAYLTEEDSAARHTTIAGLERSETAIAANSLSKSDIRKGSSLQVLDSNDASTAEDLPWKMWWTRTFPQAWTSEEIALAVGALVTFKARQGVITNFKGVYTLSAGVSTNKVMAKLASGLKKPNRQTLINPNDETTLQTLYKPLPIGRIRGLGGKFGDEVEGVLQVKTVGELAKVPLATLKERFGEKNATFLHRIAQGICDEPVAERTKAKSIGAGKTFQGVLSIRSTDDAKLEKWIGNLLSEIIERVESDTSRYPKTLVIGLNTRLTGGDKDSTQHISQSAPLSRHATPGKRLQIAMGLARDILSNVSSKSSTFGEDDVMVAGMSVSATNFVPIATGPNSILDAFQRRSNSSTNKDTSSLMTTGTTKRATSASTTFSGGNKPVKKSKIGTMAVYLTSATSHDDTHRLNMENILDDKGPRGNPLRIDDGNYKAGEATQTQEDRDLEHTKMLQAQFCKGRATGEESVRHPPNSTDMLDETAAEEQVEVYENDDLEYARQLQASFDRENDVLSSFRKYSKHRATSTKSSYSKRQGTLQTSRRSGGQAAMAAISKFFIKK